MNIDELRKSVGYLRAILGIEPPRKEESKEEMEDSLLSLLQKIDQDSYLDRVYHLNCADLYDLREIAQLAENIKSEREERRSKEVDALLDDLLGENESPIYQELKQIKERIEALMEKL